MPQKREYQRPRESSRDDEPYIIIVQDIPRHCRWQELKDMTRNLGGEQSLKAEVFDVGNGTQMGHCTIKGRSDAMKVYENLCARGWNGHRVRVQLSAHEKSGSLRTIEGPKESNGIVECARMAAIPHQAPKGGATTAHCVSQPLYATSALPASVMTYSPQYPTMGGWPTPPRVPPTATIRAPAASYPVASCPTYLPPTIQTQSLAVPSPYGTCYSTKSIPVNTSLNTSLPLRAAPTGTSIVLSGLACDQSESELRTRLLQYGDVIYLEIRPNSTRKPGKNNGTARASYKTPSEASRAVRHFDGNYLRDRRISVKLERDEGWETHTSRKPLHESKNRSSSNSPKQKKAAVFHSGSSSTKSKWPQDASREFSRLGANGEKITPGPLVVNGAGEAPTRRGSRSAASDSDSDSSSDDSDKESRTDDDRRHGRKVRRVTHRRRS